jgi:hypothetical protein
MNIEQFVECEFAGKAKVLRENPPQCHFVHHKSHITSPETKPRLPQWEATN